MLPSKLFYVFVPIAGNGLGHSLIESAHLHRIPAQKIKQYQYIGYNYFI
jgi:hypothetical protein